MGKGGVSGEVKFPDYIQDMHEDWLFGAGPSNLTTDVEAAMNTAFGADPFAGYSFSNPSSDVATIQSAYNTFYGAVTASVTTTDFKNLLDMAQVRADQCDIDAPIDVRTIIGRQIEKATESVEEAVSIGVRLLDSNVIEKVVEVFELEQSRNRELRVGRYMQAMSDVGATRSSALLTGLGAIYAQEQEETSKITKEIATQLFESGINQWVRVYAAGLSVDQAISSVNKNARQGTLLAGLQALANFREQDTAWLMKGTAMQAEINRQKYALVNDYEKLELDLDMKSALWDMEVFGKGMSIMGGLSGYAHPLPDKPNTLLAAIMGFSSIAASAL
jgi:hypothetical protein